MKKLIFLILFYSISVINAQSIDITFRYIELPNDNFVRIFVPGTMPSGTINDWGPNANSVIDPSAPSIMNYNDDTKSYERTYSLDIGSDHLYKFHLHNNYSGSDYIWVSDPLNGQTTNDGYNNSIINITDPLFFQPARHTNENGMVTGLSIGIFSNDNIDNITYKIGDDIYSGNDNLFDNNVFYASINPPRSLFESYSIEVTINGQLYTAYEQSQVQIIESEMPANLQYGPNWIDNQMILVVHAPSQPVIQVAISVSDVPDQESEILTMQKASGLEDIWWLEIDFPNGQYDYEYILLDGTRLPDPFSRRVVNSKTRIEIGPGGISTADDYQWQSNDYIRPSLDTLIIYELHVDDFSSMGNGQGKFEHITGKLDYLKSIGINAVELMPITEFPGTHSWGYDPNLLSAVEANYGTPEDFKVLVDQAHLRGIAIIMDIVWNHIRSSSPIWKMQPNYDLNPYIKVWTETNTNEEQGSWGMLDWDHFNSHTIDYVNQVNEIWLNEYKIDGFRYDATRFIGWDLNHQEFGIPAWTNYIRNIDSNFYQIAEHLPADPFLIDNTSLSCSWHDSFHDIILNDVHNNNNIAIDFMRQVVQLHEYNNYNNNYSNRTQAIKFMINHDEQSLIQEMVAFNTYSIDDARERDKFYATILFTSLGIPMIWQGQEFGLQTGWIDDNGNGNWDEEKLSYRPVDWSVLESIEGQDHLEHYKKLISFRKLNPALSQGTFFDLHKYIEQRVIVYGFKDERLVGNNDQVVVIANFSTYDQIIFDVPFLSSGSWYNIMNDDILITNDGNYSEYSIPSKHAVVYSKNQYQLSNKNTKNEIFPNHFLLLKAYPNPYNSTIKFQINSRVNGPAELNIFDISGKMVYSFDNLNINSGNNIFIWNSINKEGKSVPSGLYLISLKKGNNTINQKVLLVK